MSLDRKKMNKLPKVELHLHLDCSLSYKVVSAIDESVSIHQYEHEFIAPAKCNNLADFLSRAPSGIRLMQSRKQLQLVVKDLFEQLKEDNIIYAEIRFAPLQHIEKGLQPEEVVEIVADSTRQCITDTGIKAGLILCTLRHFDEEESLRTVELVEKYRLSTPVVGFDLAADEAGFSLDSHKKAFEYAIKNDIPRTAHAGEAKGPCSVWETFNHLVPSRIGHGVRSIEDPLLLEYLDKKNIHLEVCPTCNIQTGIYANYSDHPVNELFQMGISVGINTDARTLVNITLTEEYEKLSSVFNWQLNHFHKCNLNAIAHAFLLESDKQVLRDRINSEYERIK